MPVKGKTALRAQRYRDHHPERCRARMVVSHAIRDGLLQRPATCRCGSTKTQAHHADYSKPLEVTWLCRRCHLDEHGGSFVVNESVYRGPRLRDVRGRFMVAAVVIAMAFASAATADNYGTSSSEAARMTALVYRTFGTGYTGRCMVRIMWRESGGNPRAANYGDSNGGSYGLLELNGVHRWAGESLAAFRARMWNPYSHLAAARRLYDGAGFRPWGGCP